MGNEQGRNLGVLRLTMFVVGLTLASGVFSMAGDFAAVGASTGAMLLGWLICGIGMLSLALVYNRLSIVKPELTSGIYSYAKDGFGDYIGFNSAWGYWISAILAQVSFATLLFAALGNFFDIFGAGNNTISIVVASMLIWTTALVLNRGINQAHAINTIVVFAKIVPIAFMLIAVIFARQFDWEIFTANFWVDGISGQGVMDQIKGTIFTTVWIFIGIEGAVVVSGRAKTTKDSGKATMIAFLSLLALYVVITVLSYGVMPRAELAALENPSLAGTVAHVVGPWGGVLVNIAVIISLAGALFTYTLLYTDSAFAPAKQDCFPAFLKKTNANNVPTNAIMISTLVVQFFLILVLFNESSFQVCYTLSTSAIMVPYLLSGLYNLKITIKGEGLNGENGSNLKVWIITILAATYGAWMMYASGLVYVLIMALLYAPGTIMYAYARKQQGKKLFNTKTDVITCIVIMIGFITSVILIANGTISPF